jgi:hypothetical protein
VSSPKTSPCSHDSAPDPDAIRAAQTSVRQLIANGKHKAALERAKDIHKTQHTTASEALLVEAYGARIQSLLQQNLTPEAKAMLEFVRERYPSAGTRLDELTTSMAARSGALEELLRPLNDPDLATERRAAIETAIEEQVFDLAAVAGCEALSPDHPLRRAASVLHQAFLDVTSGPVPEEALALPEVSRRSPLASWKLLVRAIGAFYRGEDEACRQCLDAIKSKSAPARLVPAIRIMLGDKPGAPLSGAMADLVSAATSNAETLRRSLEELDRCFASDEDGRILKGIRTAVQECRRSAGDLVERLKQHISVRCAIIELDKDKVVSALGGPSRHDAYFFRLYALELEATRDPQCLVTACGMWNEFRRTAIEEGWFAAKGVEVAALYLHMAAVLRKVPNGMMSALEQSIRTKTKKALEDLYYLQPGKLYERACVLDPHSEAFSQWLEWAKEHEAWGVEQIAKAWHKILPGDIKPLLFLIAAAERNGAFHTALEHLAKAERIDGLHSNVRNARLRLLAGNAMRQIQQKKTDIAEKTLDAMAALPQAQQRDRQALVAALRYMASAVSGNRDQAAVHRAEVERRMESSAGASMLIAVAAAGCRRSALEKMGSPQKLSPAERATLPAAVAGVSEIARDIQVSPAIPWNWVVETAKQFSNKSHLLETGQLHALGETALSVGHFELAYAASTAGLERGTSTEAGFLLLRARSLPERQFVRRAVCAATAAELARQRRDMALVEEAVEFLRNVLATDGPPVTLDQTVEVLQKEKAEPRFPKGKSRGPDYRSMAPAEPCPCPECRRARGEYVDPDEDFDEDDEGDPFIDEDEIDEIIDGFEIPKEMPPEIARMLLNEMKEAMRRGESPDLFFARLFAGRGPQMKSRKKGRSK